MLSYAAVRLDGRGRNPLSSATVESRVKGKSSEEPGALVPFRTTTGDNALAQFFQVFYEDHAGKFGAGEG
jgi:hypothetical protein